MKYISCLVFVLSLTSSSGIFAAGHETPKVDLSQAVTVQSAIEQVKQALSDAQTDMSREHLKNFPPLKQVDLALQTVFAEKVGGGFKFWIISIGGSWEKDRSQELDISLVPPNPGNPKKISTNSLTQSLVQAIVSAAEGVNNAGEGEIPLNTSSVVVKISFTVKKDVNGGVSTPELSPITADSTGDLSKTAVQTLTLTFSSSPSK